MAACTGTLKSPTILSEKVAILIFRKVTVVAEMITELIRFEPEICICNGN